MKPRKNHSESGFTLIEVIITIIVIAVVAAMMTAYFGTGIIQSSLPIFRLTASAKLNAVMEKISAQYGQYPNWQPDTTYAAGAIILPSPAKRTGLLYTTTSGGRSGADLSLEPNWKTAITMGSTVSGIDGNITWKTVWESGHDSITDNGAAPVLALSSWQSNIAYSANAVIYENVSGGWRQYLCTNSNGILVSGTVKPVFATYITSGSIAPETTPAVQTPKLQWQYVGYAPTYTQNATVYTGGLKDAINTGCTAANCVNPFGRYRIIDNKFIRFVNKNEDTDVAYNPLPDTNTEYGKYLKVTLGLYAGDADAEKTGTLTTLFVLR